MSAWSCVACCLEFRLSLCAIVSPNTVCAVDAGRCCAVRLADIQTGQWIVLWHEYVWWYKIDTIHVAWGVQCCMTNRLHSPCFLIQLSSKNMVVDQKWEQNGPSLSQSISADRDENRTTSIPASVTSTTNTALILAGSSFVSFLC